MSYKSLPKRKKPAKPARQPAKEKTFSGFESSLSEEHPDNNPSLTLDAAKILIGLGIKESDLHFKQAMQSQIFSDESHQPALIPNSYIEKFFQYVGKDSRYQELEIKVSQPATDAEKGPNQNVAGISVIIGKAGGNRSKQISVNLDPNEKGQKILSTEFWSTNKGRDTVEYMATNLSTGASGATGRGQLPEQIWKEMGGNGGMGYSSGTRFISPDPSTAAIHGNIIKVMKEIAPLAPKLGI